MRLLNESLETYLKSLVLKPNRTSENSQRIMRIIMEFSDSLKIVLMMKARQMAFVKLTIP
jgi:hypothetical protein